jgi:hypothetical protein
MKKKLSLSLEVLRESVMNEWDPIGVKDIPEAADEYDAYLGEIRQLVMANASIQHIFDYLWKVETQTMGLTGNREGTMHFAKHLSKLH